MQTGFEPTPESSHWPMRIYTFLCASMSIHVWTIRRPLLSPLRAHSLLISCHFSVLETYQMHQPTNFHVNISLTLKCGGGNIHYLRALDETHGSISVACCPGTWGLLCVCDAIRSHCSVDHFENVYEKRVRKKQPKVACPSGPLRQSLCLCIDRNEKWS